MSVSDFQMSKSIDGYYQETGRAGRDGKTSDCILFYRGPDSPRLASMIYSDTDGPQKRMCWLSGIADPSTPDVGVRRGQKDLPEDSIRSSKYRHLTKLILQYFSTSAQITSGAWDHGDSLTGDGGSGAVATCGSCDNCLRDPDSIVTKDVTLETWKIIQVVQEIDRSGGRATLSSVSDLVRGLGGGNYTVLSSGNSKKRKPDPEKATLDVASVAGSKVALSKDVRGRSIFVLTHRTPSLF